MVLLTLLMPIMSGQEVLRRMKASPDMRHIPVIVATTDLAQEIECLNLGTSDFTQKPYPNPAQSWHGCAASSSFRKTARSPNRPNASASPLKVRSHSSTELSSVRSSRHLLGDVLPSDSMT